MSCTCIQGEMPAPIGHFMCFTNQKPIHVKALLVYERERETKRTNYIILVFFQPMHVGQLIILPLWIFAQHPYTHPTLFQASVGLLYRWMDMYLGAYLGVQNWKQLLSFYKKFGTYSSSLFASTNTTIALVHTQNFHLLKEQEFIYHSTFLKC